MVSLGAVAGALACQPAGTPAAERTHGGDAAAAPPAPAPQEDPPRIDRDPPALAEGDEQRKRGCESDEDCGLTIYEDGKCQYAGDPCDPQIPMNKAFIKEMMEARGPNGCAIMAPSYRCRLPRTYHKAVCEEGLCVAVLDEERTALFGGVPQ